MANTPSSDDMDKPDSERLSRLYRTGARPEPPASLDERILAEARKSVRPGKKGGHSPFGWGAPLSLAAVVMLSVTVVLLLSREGVDPLPPEASQSAGSRPESAPARPPEPNRERRQAEEPVASPAEKLAEKSPPAPADAVAEDTAEERSAAATRSRLAEESGPAADMASTGISLATAPGNEVERACDLAVRRLAWFHAAHISRKNNERFEYEGKSYSGCVAVIDGDRGQLPPDRAVGGDFYPGEGSDLAAMGWKGSKAADGPDGTFYQVNRRDVFCTVDGRWDGGDDSDPKYVPSTSLRITVQCARTR